MSVSRTTSETRHSREERRVHFQLLSYEILSSHPDSTSWLMEEILFCDMLLSFDLIRRLSVAACLSNPAGQPRCSLYSLLPKDSSRTGSNSLVVSHGIAYSLPLSLFLYLSLTLLCLSTPRTQDIHTDTLYVCMITFRWDISVVLYRIIDINNI